MPTDRGEGVVTDAVGNAYTTGRASRGALFPTGMAAPDYGVTAYVMRLGELDSNNAAPVADDEADTTAEDTAIDITRELLLDGDVDPDGDPISITGFGTPDNGSVVDNGDGTITYTPDTDLNGTDSFTYTISDGRGGMDTATVTVGVTPVADVPIAVADLVSTTVDTQATGNVLTNDTDADGDVLTAVLGAISPTNGTVVLNTDGSFTYTPDAGFTGIDSFAYIASDGGFDSNEALVTIDVAAVIPSQFTISDVSKREGRTGKQTAFNFTVTREGDISSAVTINYATIPGTALAGEDYLGVTNGSLTFGLGETTKTIAITVYGDKVAEYDETFDVRLIDQ